IDASPRRAGPGATEHSAEVWRTGRRAQRLAELQILRRDDPAAARALLASTWTSESGDDRADFLRTSALGLGPDDEAFLDAALDDRTPTVRQVAADLLARLPASAYRTRAIARADPLLHLRGRGLRRYVAVTLPEPLDPRAQRAAERDGIVLRPPNQ